MHNGIVRACAVAAALLVPGLALAEDWQATASRMDAVAKSFDARQFFRMSDACTAEYAQVSPNRKEVTRARINLALINGESVENLAGSYTTQFNFSRVGFDCKRGQGQPNCIDDRYSFGSVPVKPGAEPEFCRMLISVVASCQKVASFAPSKRGCHLLDWEKDFIKAGPAKKAPSPL